MLRLLRVVLPFLPEPAPEVTLVRLEGAIGARAAPGARALTLANVERALDRAFAARHVKAVAIVVNSPGGAAAQSRLIHDRIRDLAARKQKPVFVFCEDVAASGGYMIACAGDEIFADANSVVGSIGVVGALFGFTGAMEKLGVERRVYAAGEHKVRLDPFRPERVEDVVWVKDLQARIHDAFIDLVKTRRGAKLSEAKDLFQGDVWVGAEAVSLGLVDAIGHVRPVLREKYGDKVRVRVIAQPRGLLGGRLATAFADAALDALESRLHWARFGL